MNKEEMNKEETAQDLIEIFKGKIEALVSLDFALSFCDIQHREYLEGKKRQIENL